MLQHLDEGALQHGFYDDFIVMGSMMILGNVIIIVVVLLNKHLRCKELFLIAGLAGTDTIHGFGAFSSSTRRVSSWTLHTFTKTAWECMLLPQNIAFICGTQVQAVMMVMVSVDRLMAIQWFATYRILKTPLCLKGSYWCFIIWGFCHYYCNAVIILLHRPFT